MRLGTLEYMAPEILSSWACSYASDVWSLGIVLFELHFRRHPFPQLQELDPSQESALPSAFAIIMGRLEKTRQFIQT
jgi:serine/threonine protein kinase